MTAPRSLSRSNRQRVRLARTGILLLTASISCWTVADAIQLVGTTRVGTMSTGVVARDPVLRSQAGLQTYDFVQQLRCCGERAFGPFAAGRPLDPDEPVAARLVRSGDRLTLTLEPTLWDLGTLALGFGPPFVAGCILLATAWFVSRRLGANPELLPVALLTATLGVQQLTAFDVNWTHRFERLQVATLTLIPAILLHLTLVFPRPARIYEELPGLMSPVYALAGAALVLEQILFGIYQERWILFSRIRELSTLAMGGVLLLRVAAGLTQTTDALERFRARILTYGVALAFGVPILAFAVDLAARANLAGAVLPFSFAAVAVSLGLAVGRTDLWSVDDRYRRLLVAGGVTAVSVLALFLLQLGLFRAIGVEKPLERPSFAVTYVALLALTLEALRRLVVAGVEQLSPSADRRYQRFLTRASAEDPLAAGSNAAVEFVCRFVHEELAPRFVAFLAPDRDRLCMTVGVGEVPEAVRTLDVTLASDAAQELIQSTTYLAGPELSPEQRERWRRAGLSEVELAVPVQTAEGPSGVLVLGARRHAYAPGEVELLDLLSQSAGVALGQARRLSALEDELRARSAELARALDHVRSSPSGRPLIPDDDTRFAWVGKLASGIAHEANKPLYVIEHHLARLRRDPASASVRVDAIGEELGRVRRLIGDLQAYARSHSGQLESVRIEVVLKEALSDSPRDLQVTTTGELDLSVRIDPALGIRLFQTLLQNASEAGARSVRIEVGREEGRARVRVSDDGPGIAPELRDQVFEPFFSTHRVESATGLGLAIAREIARAHGGSLELTDSGPGTAFELLLAVD